MYILKGRGITGVDDQEKVIKAGDTVWVPGQRCTGFTVPLMSPANLFLSIPARHEWVPVLK
jgi:ethanolamine utilization protein EutQ (cupin superfamily)